MSHKPYVYKRAEDLGIPVVEAKNRILVTVTDNDVVNAKKANSKHCALARASLRIPGVVAAYFFRSMAFLEYRDRMVRHLLPPSTQKEIVSFDRAQIFASGTYQLSAIPVTLSRKAQRQYSRGRTKQRQLAKAASGFREALARIEATSPKPDDSPEQREFEAKLARIEAKHLGGRAVTGIRTSKAPQPLPSAAPTKYVHRTQYIRGLREPE